MAPQASIPVAANILGTVGTVLLCVQLVPQVWHTWKTKDVDGFPAKMMFLWASCSVPFGVYSIVQNFNIPLQIQSQIFCALSWVSWGQILIYGHKWKTWKATATALTLASLSGIIEGVLVLTLKGPYDRGVTWPMLLVGVIAAVLLSAGLLPPYFELWKRGGRVVGINWLFLSIDWLGSFLSLLSLAVQETFDVLGGVLYLVIVVLELGVFTSHIIWRWRTRKLHKRAKLEGVRFDDLPETRRYQHPPKENSTPSTQSEMVEVSRPGSDMNPPSSADLNEIVKDAGVVELSEEHALPRDLESGNFRISQFELENGT